MYVLTIVGLQAPLGELDTGICHSYDYLYASLCYLPSPSLGEIQNPDAVLQFLFRMQLQA